MPITFPTYNPETGELDDLPYYSTAEVAAMLHCSETYVRTRLHDGVWDRLKTSSGYYMSARMIGDAVEQMTTHAHPAEPSDEPTQLGEPVADVDLEPLR